MTKAEERALEKYPEHSVLIRPARCGGYYADNHLREGFIEGYHQAEKDLALTHKDVASLFVIAITITRENTTPMTDEEFYRKVLKRFNKLKESNTDQ